jgi:hypothetical protein
VLALGGFLVSACGNPTPGAAQSNCTKVADCVENGNAPRSLDHIEDLTGTHFRFTSGFSYPVKEGSVWTLRLQFVDARTKSIIEDDVRNISNFSPCSGNSHAVLPALTPDGRNICVQPSGTSTLLWYTSDGLVHTVYLLPPKPAFGQAQVENVLTEYIDALR